MAILEGSGRTGGGGFCPQLSRPQWLHSRRDTAHHTCVCFLRAPGLPEPARHPCPAVPQGPTDAAVATACSGRSPASQLCVQPHGPGLRSLGRCSHLLGRKTRPRAPWDPSGKEALKLVCVIGGVGYLCACVCVCDRQTHSHTHPHTGSLLEISLKGCGRGNTVELGKKLPRRWASWERRHSPEP